MIREPEALTQQETRLVELSSQAKKAEQAVAELLHDYLQNLLYYKDADQLLLRPVKLEIERPDSESKPWRLKAQWAGEPIDSEKQELLTDVKAVTHHQFEVKKLDSEWVATIVLDV
jgi:SHS2 domain-containing protein